MTTYVCPSCGHLSMVSFPLCPRCRTSALEPSENPVHARQLSEIAARGQRTILWIAIGVILLLATVTTIFFGLIG